MLREEFHNTGSAADVAAHAINLMSSVENQLSKQALRVLFNPRLGTMFVPYGRPPVTQLKSYNAVGSELRYLPFNGVRL